MGKREDYEARTEQLILPLTERLGLELVDVEYVKEGSDYFLRAYIDKEGGVTIDDCEAVSRPLSDLLDEEDFIPDAYILEVSSPGLGRQLKKEKDFIRSIGKEVDVKLYKAVEKRKEFTGFLLENDSDSILIDEEGKELRFLKKDISLVRLTVHF